MLAEFLVVVVVTVVTSTTGALTEAVRLPVVMLSMPGKALRAVTIEAPREPAEEAAVVSVDFIEVAVTFPEEGGVIAKSAFTEPAFSATSMVLTGIVKNVAMVSFKPFLTDSMSVASAANLE